MLPAATSDHTSDFEEIISTLQTQGFYVDDGTEKHYMLGAKELLIWMRRTSQYWDWTADAGSRVESDRDAQKSAQIVQLQPGRNPRGPIAMRRIDGWLEIEIGKFYVDVHDEAVEAQILELTSWKMGLTVEGIEFRPLYSEAKFAFPQPLKLQLGSLNETDDSNDDNHQTKSRSSDLEKSTIFVNGASPPLPPSAQLKQKNNNSLQDDGVGEEMMAKLLLPADEPLLASLTRDELFSSGYDCLSKVVYFFDGMKRMIELKDRESDDLKQKLLKNEVEAQLALAAKDCELEELKKIVNVLKSDIEKVQDNAREEVRKADEKVKKAEREVENAEARAASAIENYKSSHDLKVDKHKFASKALP
ncbi:hypothetical protein BUALT_Bualt14G0040300 [Buddleja alternifolia]|uniref:Uncharacterized protein n=1 Tax=Buddleja alternifolia TaxID=168488 RepID=A0AAV6WNS8_9LAMI|nr:hypothetical protein BUALT_Bualt14G0040300 [Buddleja alternifolia]